MSSTSPVSDYHNTIMYANGEQQQWKFCDVDYGHVRLLDGEHALDLTRREHPRIRRLHHLVILSALRLFASCLGIFAVGQVLSPSDSDGSAIASETTRAVIIEEILLSGHGSPSLVSRNSDDVSFNWSGLAPSKALNWVGCYETYQCARFAVPLDYSNPSGEEAAVALIKSASSYLPDDANYRGPVLFNPGGPGESGVDFILTTGSVFRTTLGEEFDLIGFDPRGVGFTTPAFSIFYTSLEANEFYQQFPIFNINSSASALGNTYAHSQILNKLAIDRAQFVAEHMSTPTVARDMMSIVDATGQEKLQYWGFSYGTVLGATFAAMFPDKIERMVIDGVVDSENYYEGLFSNDLRDTDAALVDIYQACVEAGPFVCPIYESSASLVQARVDGLLDKLRSAPLPFYNSTAFVGTFTVVDYVLVKQLMFNTLYETYESGAFLLEALAALERGNGTLAYSASLKREIDLLETCNCPAPGEAPVPFGGFLETTFAIGCGDSVDRDESLEDVRMAYEEMARMSMFAENWYPRALCSGWQIRAKDRFNGSFEQNTSYPLLFIGNVADPVTPLWNAHKMSKGFNNSVVLTQASSGHTSISATSLCTAKAVRTYFVNGTLPEAGAVCEVEGSIFEDEASSSSSAER